MTESETKKLRITTALEERRQCIESIRQYNVQFLSSSAFITIISATASIIAYKSDLGNIREIIYVLPAFYFLALYNLIKYSIVQQALAAYMRRLEKYINSELDAPIIVWETAKIISNLKYNILFAGVQIIYYIPIGLLLLTKLIGLNGESIIKIGSIVCCAIQFILTFVLSGFLCRGQKDAEKCLKNYSLDIVSKTTDLNNL